MSDNFNNIPKPHSNAWTALMLVVVFSSSTSSAQTVDSPVAPEEAVGVLKQYCAKCHHYDMQSRLDVLDRDSLVKTPFLVEGKPEKSLIWSRISKGEMPPQDEPQLPLEQRDIVRRWIEQGAEFPKSYSRPFVNEEQILEVILNDFQKLSREDRNDTRYFSLAHLWNDPNTSEEQLCLVRAGLSKLLNSLSTAPTIVIPRAVDSNKTVFSIRLSDYGWKVDGDEQERQEPGAKRSIWNEISRMNPYAVKRSTEFAQKVSKELSSEIPYLRADWFISAASRPPLYHTILKLPENAKVLERSLGISVQANYDSGKIARAAFKKSGVSRQNRMVERHEFVDRDVKRYYWKSYDMRRKDGNEASAGDFLRRPLEPEHLFQKGPVSFLSPFKHDGGEIIWSLPNGMQAYLLVKEDDQRIDVGPTDIVSDNMKNSGSHDIVNGISCMGCHNQGMVSITSNDVLNHYQNKGGSKADKVKEIYSQLGKLLELLDADSKTFREALEQAISPFRHSDEGKPPESKDSEPITASAREYRKDLDIDDAAREMGDRSPVRLKQWISEYGANLKISAFLNEPPQKVSRDDWEAEFQKIMRSLKLGTGVIFP